MLIILLEVIRNKPNRETKDRTINPELVNNIEQDWNEQDQCIIKMNDGTIIKVVGSIKELTDKLNGSKKEINHRVLLKD